MSRRGENIYRRKDGRWEGRYVKGRTGSRTIFGYVFGGTYHETKSALAAARQAWDAARPEPGRAAASVDNVSRMWISDSESLLKESTVAKYEDYLRCYILPRFGKTDICRISDEDISGFCAELLKNGGAASQGLSPGTVSEVMRIIRNIRKYAINHGCRVEFSGDYTAIRQRTPDMRILSSGEQARLRTYLESAPDPCNSGILLCLMTGIRLGEVCALLWDDILLEEKIIHVKRTMQRIRRDGDDKSKVVITAPKSASSVRAIPLPDGIIESVADSRRAGSFFLTGDPERFIEPRTMQNRFKAALQRAGIAEINFHALRHTFATRCMEAGFDPKCLSAILGHSSVGITLNRYVHPTIEMMRKNMAKLG